MQHLCLKPLAAGIQTSAVGHLGYGVSGIKFIDVCGIDRTDRRIALHKTFKAPILGTV